MKFYLIPSFLIFILLEVGYTPLYAQYGSQRTVTLKIQNMEVSDDDILITYWLPYPGTVEFELFNGKNRLYNSSYVKPDSGNHVYKIFRSKLIADSSYTYRFIYKGVPVQGEIPALSTYQPDSLNTLKEKPNGIEN